MHILQLSDFYRPVIGGLERHVETLSRELVRLGHTVTVVTLQTGDDPIEETIDGVHIARIRGWSGGRKAFHADATRPFHPTFPDPGAIASLRRLVQREHPAIVHSHSWLQYSYFPLHDAQKGPGHVVTLHDFGLACPKRTLQHVTHRITNSANVTAADPSVTGQGQPCSGPRLAKCIACVPDQYGFIKGTAIATGLRSSRILHGRADRYIAISTAVADGSRCALPSHFKIDVIPTLVPNDLMALAHSMPRPNFLPAADGYLMFVGALGRYKGVDVLLKARQRMRNRVPLVLIGTPRVDTPRIDDPYVTVVRNVASAQVMASWMHASVAVVPSIVPEGMGQVAVEAMLAGRAVVASNLGGLRDVIEHNVTGLMIPPGDPEALATALDTLLDNPETRQRMGEAGRLRARQFEASAVTPRVVEVFEDVLRQRANSCVGRF